jgi:hypothetical protein
MDKRKAQTHSTARKRSRQQRSEQQRNRRVNGRLGDAWTPALLASFAPIDISGTANPTESRPANNKALVRKGRLIIG